MAECGGAELSGVNSPAPTPDPAAPGPVTIFPACDNGDGRVV